MQEQGIELVISRNQNKTVHLPIKRDTFFPLAIPVLCILPLLDFKIPSPLIQETGDY